MNALAFAVQILAALPDLIAAGRDVSALIKDGQASLEAMQAEGRVPTPAEWDALNKRITSLRAALHADGDDE